MGASMVMCSTAFSSAASRSAETMASSWMTMCQSAAGSCICHAARPVCHRASGRLDGSRLVAHETGMSRSSDACSSSTSALRAGCAMIAADTLTLAPRQCATRGAGAGSQVVVLAVLLAEGVDEKAFDDAEHSDAFEEGAI